MTINEGLRWQKDLKERRQELVNLRSENSSREERLFGDKRTINKEPVYNVKTLDIRINQISKEIRLLDNHIKSQNAKTEIEGYTPDESVLGEIE